MHRSPPPPYISHSLCMCVCVSSFVCSNYLSVGSTTAWASLVGLQPPLLCLFCSSIKLEFNFELSPLRSFHCATVSCASRRLWSSPDTHTHTDTGTHTCIDRNFDVDVNFIFVDASTNFVVSSVLSFVASAVAAVVDTHTHTQTHTYTCQSKCITSCFLDCNKIHKAKKIKKKH